MFGLVYESNGKTCEMQDFPPALKVQVTSFLCIRDALSLGQTCGGIHDDLAMARISMRIPFKSWYDDAEDGPQLKRGPKLPFLKDRTHSITLSGSWSCRFGELQGRHSRNFEAQFYIIAYPCVRRDRESDRHTVHHTKPKSKSDGRTVWASSPIYQRHGNSSANSDWVQLTVNFVPNNNEEYYLCIQPGSGTASQQDWWRHALVMSNLMSHVTYHDKPHTNLLMQRQFKFFAKHMREVENRGAYYTKVLEAVARSIRIQLTRFGRNALDPVLESFFSSTGLPRDTESLLVLEELARFLSQYSYINERTKRHKTSNPEIDSTKEGGSSNRGSSVPDWMLYAESSSAANRTDEIAVASIPVQDSEESCRKPSRQRQLQSTVQQLFRPLLGAGGGRKRGKSRRSRRAEYYTWRTHDETEEITLSGAAEDSSQMHHPGRLVENES